MTIEQHASLPEQPMSTLTEARQLEDNLLEVMSTLQDVVQRETAFVRAGKVRDAIALDQEKGELSQRYLKAITKIKSNQDYLAQATPELLKSLHREHDNFRNMLKANLTVLATAHAVSEGIVRGVNGEVAAPEPAFRLHGSRKTGDSQSTQRDAAVGEPLALSPPLTSSERRDLWSRRCSFYIAFESSHRRALNRTFKRIQ